MRGLPASTELEEIKEDLNTSGVDVMSIYRVMSQRTPRKMLPLFSIKGKRTEARIKNINRCLNVLIKIDKQKVSTVRVWT